MQPSNYPCDYPSDPSNYPCDMPSNSPCDILQLPSHTNPIPHEVGILARAPSQTILPAFRSGAALALRHRRKPLPPSKPFPTAALPRLHHCRTSAAIPLDMPAAGRGQTVHATADAAAADLAQSPCKPINSRFLARETSRSLSDQKTERGGGLAAQRGARSCPSVSRTVALFASISAQTVHRRAIDA